MKKKTCSEFTNKHVYIFYRPDNNRAIAWTKKIQSALKGYGAHTAKSGHQADIVIALGGDGTILEAARLYGSDNTIVLGMNLGNVGFLASVREERNFIKGLNRFANNEYSLIKRMMIDARVIRNGKTVFSTDTLNDITVQHLLGMVELEVFIDSHPVQSVRGNGILISTATGSTAYNLSAHGPIVSPDIQCMIVTELLDHHLPTPSIVIKPSHEIDIRVKNFREHRLLSSVKGKEPIDVVLSSDGDQIFPLRKGDVVRVTGSHRPVVFAELEKSYFFKSLKEKFMFN